MFEIADTGRVRTLVVDNPEHKNAISSAGWVELAGHFEAFEASEQRALVITGAGTDFCSGADLGGSVFTDHGIAARYADMRQVGKAATALYRISKPTVAAVEGVAVGAGMNLALACDIVIASRTARFSEIFVKRGLTVDFGGTWLLPRLVGLATARDLALTGRMVGGEEAATIGLAARVVEPEHLQAEALEAATALAAGAPLAQRFIKTGLNRSLDMTFEQALAYEDQAQAILLSSEDVVEGVTAFLSKRDPDFKGR
ncbi:MAG: enoyl-CoA hydratase/isomerase family protein [Acidimicrobiia bacterium]|nr:enoyl-CoA hydratase/isomerase family protein [Acidimicrobiia bacterium]